MDTADQQLKRLRLELDEQSIWQRSVNKINKRLLLERINEIEADHQAKAAILGTTESAMLNILEDSQLLERELEKSKAGLERTVEERTLALREERVKLVASIRSLPFGFLMIDNRDEIIMVNFAVQKILDKSDITTDWIAEQFIGKLNFLENVRKCREDKKPIDIKSIEYGAKILRISLTPVMAREHQEVIGLIILIEDITEAKVMERSREEFFAVASHEMRTPLTAIRGNMSLIRDFLGEEIKNPEIKEMIDDTYSASVRLINIVNDFLDASRLEQGRVSLKKENFDLVKLAEEVTRELSALAEAKKIKLECEECPSGLPPAFADRDRAKQIIYNLVSNAIHYTEKGGASIQIVKEGDFLKIAVRDTGMGISLENRNLLFRKFQQAGEKILARNITQSAGLGLYISKLLAEAMGGRIWLEKSEFGKGSIFAFTLPIAS